MTSIGGLSASTLEEIAGLTGVSVADLVLELIKIFARPDSSLGGGVWLAFASFICPLADNEQSQIALKRLLGSDAARLARNVSGWSPGRKRSIRRQRLQRSRPGLFGACLGPPMPRTGGVRPTASGHLPGSDAGRLSIPWFIISGKKQRESFQASEVSLQLPACKALASDRAREDGNQPSRRDCAL